MTWYLTTATVYLNTHVKLSVFTFLFACTYHHFVPLRALDLLVSFLAARLLVDVNNTAASEMMRTKVKVTRIIHHWSHQAQLVTSSGTVGDVIKTLW